MARQIWSCGTIIFAATKRLISEYDKISTPSPRSSYNLKGTTPSSYKSSPSPDKESDNNNLDSLDKIDINKVDYNSLPSSPNINKLYVENNKSDIGLIIGIIISSCLFITITIFGVLKYKKNKLMSNAI